MRILLIQAFATEARANLALLSGAGFVADNVVSPAEATEYLGLYTYDAIVIDRDLREMKGEQLVRQIRAKGDMTPLLLLVTSTAGQIVSTALRDGADDVVVKSASAEELIARIEALIRRCHGCATSVLEWGPMAIDMSSHEVWVGERSLALTRREFAVLKMLALRRGKLVSKQAILDNLYDGLDSPEIGVIGVFICNLRKKLAQACGISVIDTVRGSGYVIREYCAPSKAARIETSRHFDGALSAAA